MLTTFSFRANSPVITRGLGGLRDSRSIDVAGTFASFGDALRAVHALTFEGRDLDVDLLQATSTPVDALALGIDAAPGTLVARLRDNRIPNGPWMRVREALDLAAGSLAA